eukprot:6175191-Pleurochrysis_carterae.AAC.1
MKLCFGSAPNEFRERSELTRLDERSMANWSKWLYTVSRVGEGSSSYLSDKYLFLYVTKRFVKVYSSMQVRYAPSDLVLSRPGMVRPRQPQLHGACALVGMAPMDAHRSSVSITGSGVCRQHQTPLFPSRQSGVRMALLCSSIEEALGTGIVQSHGRLQSIDAKGCVINDASPILIQDRWRVPLQCVVEEWKKLPSIIPGARLIAVYARGSIPRGLALEGVSDIDTLGFA